jgi:hypothetical protein
VFRVSAFSFLIPSGRGGGSLVAYVVVLRLGFMPLFSELRGKENSRNFPKKLSGKIAKEPHYSEWRVAHNA